MGLAAVLLSARPEGSVGPLPATGVTTYGPAGGGGGGGAAERHAGRKEKNHTNKPP